MKKLSLLLIGLLLATPFLASAASYPVGGYQYYLSGAGVTSSATSIQLTSFKTPDGRNLTMSNFGAIGYGTLDPQTTAKLENITFTGITQNSNGTALLTGVTRGVDFITPYTASSTLTRSHSGGATFIITNTASYYGQQFALSNNPTVVTDYWTFPTPIANSNPATKSYVDNLVNGGTITNTAVIAPGVAGETFATGTPVYFKRADARWYKAGTGISESVTYAIVGISQGSGTAGNTINSGVLLYGLDTTQVGMTAGRNIFVDSVAGATTTATTTIGLGKAMSATQLYVDTHFYGPALSIANTFTGSNTFTSTNTFTGTTTLATTTVNGITLASTTVTTFTSSGTWVKPTSGTMALVRLWGGGGGGATDNGGASTGGGGGGGCYTERIFLLSTLGATETVTIPAAASAGAGGGTVTFGSWLSAFGGAGGVSNSTGTIRGGGGGGLLGAGSGTTGGLPSDPIAGSASASPLGGKSGVCSGGGGSGAGDGGAAYYGGGGGAGSGAGQVGGASTFAGAGGAVGQNGVAPSGGGGAQKDDGTGSAGSGAVGQASITVF